MLPPELQSLLDQVAACERDAERLVSDMDEDTVNRTPPAGGWSVAQCLEHLALMNDFYLRGWQEAVDQAARSGRGTFAGLRPTWAGRWFARSMEPPVKMKVKSIAAATPQGRAVPAEILQRFSASHDAYRQLVRAAAAVDANRLVRPNAIVKLVKMRLATVLLLLPAHDRRHLWQAANVKREVQGA